MGNCSCWCICASDSRSLHLPFIRALSSLQKSWGMFLLLSAKIFVDTMFRWWLHIILYIALTLPFFLCLSGAKISYWRHPYGSVLCGRVSKFYRDKLDSLCVKVWDAEHFTFMSGDTKCTFFSWLIDTLFLHGKMTMFLMRRHALYFECSGICVLSWILSQLCCLCVGFLCHLLALIICHYILIPNLDVYVQFVSLVNPSISVYCEILRDCYESFAMYCFGRYLVACLGMPIFWVLIYFSGFSLDI